MNHFLSGSNGNLFEEMEFEDDTPGHDENARMPPSGQNNGSTISNANQTKPGDNCAGQTVTVWKSRQTHSLENIKEMLRLSLSSDSLGENTVSHKQVVKGRGDKSEESIECFGLSRIFENVNVNTSEEFLFKDTYFEDMENLEFVYDPILCLSTEDIASIEMEPSKVISHCLGCNCIKEETSKQDIGLCFKQDPGRRI